MKSLGEFICKFIESNTAVETDFVAYSTDVNNYYEYKLHSNIDEKVLDRLNDKLSWAINTDKNDITMRKIGSKLFVEVEKENKSTIFFSCLMNNDSYRNEFNKLPLGLKSDGSLFYFDISNKENLGLIGSTQQGKSSALYSIITALLLKGYKSNFDLYLLDPIKNKFNIFKDINRCNVANTFNQTREYLQEVCNEIDNRKELLSFGITPSMIIVVIDEFQQLLDTDKDNKDLGKYIETIASVGLEFNVRLVVSTQKLIIDTAGKRKNLINNILGRVYFRTERKKLNGYELSSLRNAGDCIVVHNGETNRVRLGYLPNDTLKNILSKLSKKEKNAIKTIEQDNTDIDSIINAVPREVIQYILFEYIKNENVISANTMRKELMHWLGSSQTQYTQYCKVLEDLGILKNLGNNKPRRITERGKRILNLIENRFDFEINNNDNVIPIKE